MEIKGIFEVLTIVFTIRYGYASKCLWKMAIQPNINPLQIGDIMNLTCTYIGNNTPSSTVSILDQNGEVIPSTWVTPRTIMSTREINRCPQYGTYCCQSEHCRRSLISCKTIDVEDLSKKPSLECIYNNYIDAQANIRCKWQPTYPGNRYMWNLRFKSSMDSKFLDCPMMSRSSTSCVIPAIDFIVTNYTIKLQLIEQRQNRTYGYTISTDDTILRMDVRLESITAVSSTQLNISLRLSNTKENMICQLFYSSEWEPDLKKASFSLSYLPMLTVSLLLGDLEPFTTYSIYARCKPLESLYWSQPSRTSSARTLPDVPSSIPRNIRFSDELDRSGQRHVHLYWKPIPKRRRGGKFTEYTISYPDINFANKTDMYPPDSVTALLKSLFPTKSEIRLVIGSRNEAGNSSKSMTFIVPSFHEANLQPVVNAGQDMSNITVFWKGHVLQSGQRSLTFYWCEGPNRIAGPPLCEKFPDSITTNSSEVTIDTDIQSNGRRYFGVSSKESGRRIIWSNCVFTESLSVEVKPMLLTASRYNSSTIEVNLQRDFCDFDSMPWLYQVQVEPIDKNCSQLDNQDYNNFTAAPSIKELYVHSTIQEATICFRVLFKNGLIEDSRFSIIAVSATESKDNPLVEWLVIRCAPPVAVILIIVLSLSCWKYRKRLRNTTKIEDVDIWPSTPQEYHGVYVKTLNDSMSTSSSDGDSVMTQSSTVSTQNDSEVSTETANNVTVDYKNCGEDVTAPSFQNDVIKQSQTSSDNPIVYSEIRCVAMQGNREDTKHSMDNFVQQTLRGDSYQDTSTGVVETISSGINHQSDMSSAIINYSIPEDDITSYAQINIQSSTSSSEYNTNHSVNSYTLAAYSGCIMQNPQMNDLSAIQNGVFQNNIDLSHSLDSNQTTHSAFSIDYVVGTHN